MAAKNRPYEQFGPFILFKRLESSSLGDLWRAGRIDGAQLGKTVAVHRLTGGKREAFVAAATEARALAPLLTGTTFAKDQVIDVVNGTPFIAHEYGGGRSLRHIVDRARGANGVPPNPIPLEQAIVIAEKVALSLATTADLRYLGNRLAHGALVPQFIWIADDGEIRVAGQQLGKAMLASLSDPKFSAELNRYFAPEYASLGEPNKATEVYSMGAILYLLVTGNEPPEAVSTSAFANTIHAAKTALGQPIPEDIRTLIHKSLNIDPAVRFASIADMKQAISALAHGGKYSATTFNLAFYLSNLLKKEMEGEALDREKEGKVNVAAYAEAPAAPAPVVSMPTPVPFIVEDELPQPKKSRAGLIAAAIAVVLIGGGAAAWMMLKPKTATTAAALAPKTAPVKAQITAPAVISSTPLTSSAPATGTMDPAAQKRAFEQAVEQKLQEEMMKLQSDYTKSLKQQQSKNAPVQTIAATSAPAPAQADDTQSSAAQLDARRLATRQDSAPAQTATQQAAPAVTLSQNVPQPQPQAAAPAPVVATVKEGDVVEFTELDSIPMPVGTIKADYPRLAMQQRAKGQVIVSALISENGDVLDVKVLKGDTRFGFNEAAIRAMRAARFSPPVKDGKHVRTWRPQTFVFSL